MKFTEAEKNEIIGHCVDEMVVNHTIACPIPGDIFAGCAETCGRIFSRTAETERCPCSLYGKKYVKDKFWEAMR